MRVLALSTTTHDPKKSTSVALIDAALVALQTQPDLDVEVKTVHAADLHIVPNLSCYAGGKKNCADPKAGPYRCWAHHLSVQDPEKYGGKDEMPVIYDGLAWADAVLFGVSVRWGSHNALAQSIIERMNTLENRHVSYGEPNPLRGKRLGVVVGGLHWNAQGVAQHLEEVFRFYGFETTSLVWQRSQDLDFEHPDPDKPYAERWLSTPTGKRALGRFLDALKA
jgi:multimeric flavodoxin WrbA